MNHSPASIRNLISTCRAAALVVLCAAAFTTFAGCRSAASGDSNTVSASGSSTSIGSQTAANPAVMAQIERDHVIGPAGAGELNYRVAWQFVGAGRNIKLMTVEGDSVFVLDGLNYLTRIKIQDGNHLWRIQVAESSAQAVGINFSGDRVYVTTGGDILALDPNTGSQLAKQPLQQIANTQPVMFGPYLIYGSRSGQLIWHSGIIGYQWRGYKVGHSINVPAVISDGLVVAAGSNGEVMVLDAATTHQLWGKYLLAPVVAPPVAGDGAAFVAGQDQYLWAFDLHTGRNTWKVLMESPLTDSPTLIGDRVYQNVPRKGLYCFLAQPEDTPGGKLIWNSPKVDASVILQRNSQLFAWNAAAKRMTIVDATRGAIVKSIEYPSVKKLVVGGEHNDEFYAVSDDGRVVRLVPRN